MVAPIGPKTLLEQMKIVVQEFFVFFPKDSHINYKAKDWIVTGDIDKVTGQAILRSTTDGTTLFNPIPLLHPDHVPAPLPTAPITAASAGGSNLLQTILPLGGTAAQIWQTSKITKQPPAAAGAS